MPANRFGLEPSEILSCLFVHALSKVETVRSILLATANLNSEEDLQALSYAHTPAFSMRDGWEVLSKSMLKLKHVL